MSREEDYIYTERKAIVRRILSALRERNWTQKKFAEVWGRPESQVSKILSGNVDMQVSTLIEIERLLGIELLRRDRD